LHFDNAEVTLNVSLDDEYDGGDLVFRGMKTEPKRESDFFGYEHRLGEGVLHLGALRHEAMPLTRGKRTNLIIWMRSSMERVLGAGCPRCDRRPSEVLAIGESYGDGVLV